MGDNCYEDCAGAPFDCTCCSRMCEPYSYDEEKQEYVYKDLFRPKTSPVVFGGKWYKDIPCCVAKQQMYQAYKRCDKLSLKDFNKANELRKEITKSYTQLNKCTDEEMKVSIKEEISLLDKELKDITDLSYKDVFNSLNAKSN